MIVRISILLFVLTGCSKYAEFNIPYDGDKIVVNSVLCSSCVVNAKVTRSYNPNETAPEDVSIPDATVKLFENDIYVETLTHVENGLYVSDSKFKPLVDNYYKLQIENAGMPSVETRNTVIPRSFPLVSLSSRIVESERNRDEPALEIEIGISDNVDIEDYYLIAVKGYAENDPEIYEPYIWIAGDNGDFELPCAIERSGKIVYEDKCFNGEIYKGIIRVDFMVSTKDFKRQVLETLEISMQKIAPEYFTYLKSSQLVEGIELGFFDPQFLYSNVEHGFGIFTSTNERIEYVTIP